MTLFLLNFAGLYLSYISLYLKMNYIFYYILKSYFCYIYYFFRLHLKFHIYLIAIKNK